MFGNSTSASEVHFENAESAIDLTPSGSTIDSSDEQPENARGEMRAQVAGISAVFSAVQPKKTSSGTAVKFSLKVNEVIAGFAAKAPLPTYSSSSPSNESIEAPLNASSPTETILRGAAKVASAAQPENARSPTVGSESESTVIVLRLVKSEQKFSGIESRCPTWSSASDGIAPPYNPFKYPVSSPSELTLIRSSEVHPPSIRFSEVETVKSDLTEKDFRPTQSLKASFLNVTGFSVSSETVASERQFSNAETPILST